MAQILACIRDLLPNYKISQTKVQKVYQSVQTYSCERPKGQPTTLRPYVIDAPLNLIERDLPIQ